MRTIIFILICLSVLSCKEKKTNNLLVEKTLPPIMDITSYTGNVVAFFTDSIWSGVDHYTMQLITIQETDSNIFKQDTFDLVKHVKGKPSLYFSYGTEIYKLYKSKYKKKYDLNICNVYKKSNAYIKLWISYENYLDIKKELGDTILTDSCAYRMISDGPGAVLKEFKILTLPE